MMLESVILQVILVVLCCIVPVENRPLSDSTCPTPLKITPRDLNCSNNEVYHIVRDPRSDRYIEGCFIPLMVPPGKETTLDISGNINTEDCDEETFQRHPYRSNTQCACMETKGQCNKTGQIVASNGNTTHDRTCRCDFRRGYKFSIKPSNECFCQSSSEDCTCIKEECKTGYRLSPDYECVPENSTTNYTCKDYISEESTTKSVPDNDTFIPERMPTDKQLPWYMIAIIVICSVLVLVVVVVCVLIYCKKCRPGRNGSTTTNNKETSKGKDSDPVQETEKQEIAQAVPVHEENSTLLKDTTILSIYQDLTPGSDRANEKLIKVDKLENEVTYKPSTEDTVLDYTVE